ncbi:MAG: hypothetical protein ACM3OC_06765 [Deltaproteobacteria bacterium]
MVERTETGHMAVTKASWGAIFAGFVTVIAVQITLSLLGIGLGIGTLGMAGTQTAQGVGIGSLIWLLVTSLIAFFAGGWVAGKLSPVLLGSSAALHGFVVWGFTSLVTLTLLTSTVGSLLGGTFSLMSSALGAGTSQISQMSPQQKQQMGSQAQQMLGMNKQQQGPQSSTQAGMGAPAPTVPPEVGSMVQKMAQQGPDSLTPQDKESAINALQSRNNMDRQQAESTVNNLITTARNIEQGAAAAAKAAAAAGLSGFVLMVLTALFSMWGASVGRVKLPVQAT